MKKLILVVLVCLGFTSLAQEKKVPNIVANNTIALEAKYGRSGESFRAFQLSYERFVYRSSLVTAHGLKVSAGQYAWTGTDFSNYKTKADFIVSSYVGAFRHFLVLELGYSYLPKQADFSIYPISTHKAIVNVGYKYHRLKPGPFFSIMAGNNANISLGLGYSF